MKLSHPDSALRTPGCTYQRGKQAAQDCTQVVAPVEAELHVGQVAVGVLGELDGVVRSGERSLDLAYEGVDGPELLVEDAGLAATVDLTVVDSPRASSHLEAVQAVRDEGQQLHRQEPDGQGQLAGFEDRAAEDTALVLAACALPVATALPLEARTGLADAAARALEAPRPSTGDERSFTALLGPVLAQELSHRQPRLELNSVHRHGASPWWMQPSSGHTGSRCEPAELRR
jgi:hypothetical protein